MTPSDRAAAQAALNEGRAVYGRLDQIRGPEDAAADIMELWASAESAMRAMLGGSSLSGQALVRELRQRAILNLEQANALASFWDARSRSDHVAYKPTLTDVGFARAGYNELGRIVAESASSSGASSATAGSTSTFAPGGTPSTAPAAAPVGSRPITVPDATAGAATPQGAGSRVGSASRVSRPLMIALAILVVVVIAAAAVYMTRGRSNFDSEMASAATLMTTGRTEAARAAFGSIAHEYPDKAAPHVFLSRLARNDTPPDMNTARQELITAIRLEPAYEPAQREMGIFQLADHNPSLARNFLVRAVQLSPADSAAQGYLGCALIGLNRVDDAQKFLARAGNGTWSSCTSATPAAATSVSP